MEPAFKEPIFIPHWYGAYELLRPLGVGGMAEVFLARTVGAQGFEKVVVLKRMLARLADQPRFVQMFVAEAKLAVQLRHANIVQILGLEELDGRPFIVMEYVHGRDLHALLRTAVRSHVDVPTDFVVHALSEMLRGLGHAHEAVGPNGQPLHLLHRDVTPSNVFISFDGEVKLGDFGVAHSSNQAENQELRGKHGYLAPEVLQRLSLDHRADLFSAGVVLWEALAGRRLFVGRSDREVLLQVRDRPIEPPSQHNPRGPPDLDRITLQALCRDREQRFQSAHDFEEALSDYLFARRLRWTRRRIAEVMQALFPVDSAPLVLPPPSPREGAAAVDSWEDFSEQSTRNLVANLGALTRTPTRPPTRPSAVGDGEAARWPILADADAAVLDEVATAVERATPSSDEHPWVVKRGDDLEPLALDALVARLADPAAGVEGVGVRDGPRLARRHFGELTYWDALAGQPATSGEAIAVFDLQQTSLVRLLYEATLRRTSALFVVESESGRWQRWIWLRGGYPLYLASDRPDDGILPTLLRQGAVEREWIARALEVCVRRMLPLDRALLLAAPEGHAPRIERAFAEALGWRLYPAFAWRQGRLRAFRDAEAPPLRPSLRLPPLLGLLIQAVRHAVGPDELQADLAPRGRRAIALAAGRAAHLEALRPGPLEQQVLAAIDGQRNLDGVLRASDVEDLPAARALLYVLVETGLALMA